MIAIIRDTLNVKLHLNSNDNFNQYAKDHKNFNRSGNYSCFVFL